MLGVISQLFCLLHLIINYPQNKKNMNHQQITYKAFYVEENDGKYIQSIKKLNISDLPKGDVLIRVYFHL